MAFMATATIAESERETTREGLPVSKHMEPRKQCRQKAPFMATAANAGNTMEIMVPALQQLYGAMWAEDTSEVLVGEGL